MIVTPLRTTGLQGISDLTVIATVKDGFVPGAYGHISYLARLSRVLAALDGVSRATREPALLPSPFADLVGRFRGIHFFRFATLPARDASNPHRFLLNVTFDGGWEPYMRVIWGPLGTLLDLMFCNCVDYPLAFHCSFDDYMRWVRANERPAGFFYADSGATVADTHYRRLVEEQQRNAGGAADADAIAAGLALPVQPSRAIPSEYAVSTALRALKTYAGMRGMFPTSAPGTPATDQQDAILYRFVQDLLRDLRGWVAHGLFDPGQPFDRARAVVDAELRWLMTPSPQRHIEPERLLPPRPAAAAVQAGITGPYPATVREGVLVLLRIQDKVQAKDWLKANPPTDEATSAAGTAGLYMQVAITLSGLRALDVPPAIIDTLPREFREGMEARAGVLGDLRGNHPAHWRRPRRNWPAPVIPGPPAAGPEIQLGTVHLVVQLRSDQPIADAVITALGGGTTGLVVQHVQRMQLQAPRPGAAAGRDLFGFVDGLSQPTLLPPAQPRAYWSDQVKPGELFLGYGNSRGDGPLPPNDPRNTLLDDGSFMVVRKLRQYPERLDALVTAAASQLLPNATNAARRDLADLIKAKMMGRRLDGTPLVTPPGAGGNDFDYRNDARGAQCPFQAHIRRANPREPLPLQLPARIARRGMSWSVPQPPGATAPPECGLMFIAYNASIAEQFEVIQRWISGANSSGISSEQSDALLGVPEAGRRRIYRFLDDAGQVMRVDLGNDPLVTLEWGLYAFMPSLAAIKAIAAGIDEPPKPPPPDEPDVYTRWRQRLDDDDAEVRQAAWDWVSAADNGLRYLPDYGWLVAKPALVLEVLRDDGSRFSTHGYGDRMADSIGRGFLGMDNVGLHDGHQKQAPAVNAAIEKAVPEAAAYALAYGHAGGFLDDQVVKARGAPPVIDLVALVRHVIAQLCTAWFGLPDEALMTTAPASEDQLVDRQARCPAHLLAASRSIFAANPSQQVTDVGSRQGMLVREAVTQMLRKADREKIEERFQLSDLVVAIRTTKELKDDLDLQARTIAGVMTGFPATVLGSLVSVLVKWVGSGDLWEWQQALPLAPAPDHATASQVLRQPLLQTMKQASVPHVVWRTAAADTTLGGKPIKAGQKVIVSLKEAVKDRDAGGSGDAMLMFGGKRRSDPDDPGCPTDPNDPDYAPHACSGYWMAMGTMLGCVAALLASGTLRPTADPRLLMLVKP